MVQRFFKFGLRHDESRIGHGYRMGCGGALDGDLLIGHGEIALGHLAGVGVFADCSVLAQDGEWTRGMQFLDLAPCDGHFAGHIALENDGVAFGALKLADQFFTINEDQNIRLLRRARAGAWAYSNALPQTIPQAMADTAKSVARNMISPDFSITPESP